MVNYKHQYSELPYRVVEKSREVWNFAAETKKTIIQ